MGESEKVTAAVRGSAKRHLVGTLVGLVLMILAIAGLVVSAFAAQRAGNDAEASRVFVGLAATGTAVAACILGFVFYLRFRAKSLARRLALLRERYPDGVAILLQRPLIIVSPGAPPDWEAARAKSIRGVLVQHRSLALLDITDRVEIIAQADDARITVSMTTRELYNSTFGQFSFRVQTAGLDATLEAIPAAVSYSVPAFGSLDECLSAIRDTAGSSIAAT
jgi:hypothetical protein